MGQHITLRLRDQSCRIVKSAGLAIVPVVLWECAPAARAPNQLLFLPCGFDV